MQRSTHLLLTCPLLLDRDNSVNIPSVVAGNWCIQGPVVDFRHSTDKGETWTEERVNATGPSDNLFGETAAHNSKVKFGARENAIHPVTRHILSLQLMLICAFVRGMLIL